MTDIEMREAIEQLQECLKNFQKRPIVYPLPPETGIEEEEEITSLEKAIQKLQQCLTEMRNRPISYPLPKE